MEVDQNCVGIYKREVEGGFKVRTCVSLSPKRWQVLRAIMSNYFLFDTLF